MDARRIGNGAYAALRPARASFAASEIIHGPGIPRLVGIVETGLVRMFSMDASGRAITHRNVGVGRWIGLGMVLGQPGTVGAQAVGRVDVLALDPSAARRLWQTDIGFCRTVSREIYRDLIDTDDRTSFQGRGRQARHLAFELLDRAHGSGDGRLTVAGSHDDLAQALGSSREVVSRHLNRLARMGMIRQVDRRQIAVLNEADLLAFARNEGSGAGAGWHHVSDPQP